MKNKAIKILEKIGSKNNSELFDQIRYLVELLTLNNSIAKARRRERNTERKEKLAMHIEY